MHREQFNPISIRVSALANSISYMKHDGNEHVCDNLIIWLLKYIVFGCNNKKDISLYSKKKVQQLPKIRCQTWENHFRKNCDSFTFCKNPGKIALLKNRSFAFIKHKHMRLFPTEPKRNTTTPIDGSAPSLLLDQETNIFLLRDLTAVV